MVSCLNPPHSEPAAWIPLIFLFMTQLLADQYITAEPPGSSRMRWSSIFRRMALRLSRLASPACWAYASCHHLGGTDLAYCAHVPAGIQTLPRMASGSMTK